MEDQSHFVSLNHNAKDYRPGDVLTLLQERGLIKDQTSQELVEHLKVPRKVYVGFDPSSDDLHLGNLLGLVFLRWFQLCGHTPVVVLGGATGMIGDPSGKSKERNLLSKQELKKNVLGIEKTIREILKVESGLVEPIFLNNLDWFASFGYIDFLRDAGKYFRMGTMLAKESVSTRLHSPEGLSYTEFSYQTLQAYDFYHLYKEHQVTLQAGGSDQWGNITAGTELIGKLDCDAKAFGIVWPLLVRKDGKKFGKSEEGAIWLSPRKLAPYDFYQHIMRLSDDDTFSLLKKLTFLELEQVEDLQEKFQRAELAAHEAQHLLARELLNFCRGPQQLDEAIKITAALKPGNRKQAIDITLIEEMKSQLPIEKMSLQEALGSKVVDLIAKLGMSESKSAARRLISNGGVYVSANRIQDPAEQIQESYIIDRKWLLLSVGKKKKYLIEIL